MHAQTFQSNFTSDRLLLCYTLFLNTFFISHHQPVADILAGLSFANAYFSSQVCLNS